MILVFGGAFQGKEEFVYEKFGIKAQDNCVLNKFHLYIKDCLEKNKDINEALKEIEERQYKIIISDEIGMGIVPIQKEDRLWREETGRALCQLTKLAEQVWRVQCGIGSRLK